MKFKIPTKTKFKFPERPEEPKPIEFHWNGPVSLILGDMVPGLQEWIPDNSIDSCVTDPPYGLEFMGNDWDRLIEPTAKSAGGYGKDSPTNENAYAAARVRYAAGAVMESYYFAWFSEVYRVLKPGAFLLAFGGTRTYHRMACAIEDAGFEIRDSIHWVYGTGFPKSHDVGKAVDKKLGAERKVTGALKDPRYKSPSTHTSGAPMGHISPRKNAPLSYAKAGLVTAPGSPEAQEWEGWGSALKPGHEPIIVARKPFKGSLADNVLRWGTGGLNIGACRISGKVQAAAGSTGFGSNRDDKYPLGTGREYTSEGRWPANFVLSHTPECREVGSQRVKGSGWHQTGAKGSKGYQETDTFRIRDMSPEEIRERVGWASEDGTESVAVWECSPYCPVAELNRQSGHLKGGMPIGTKLNRGKTTGASIGGDGKYSTGKPQSTVAGYGVGTGASRFFHCFSYVPKPSKGERDSGCGSLEETLHVQFQTANGTSGKASSISEGRNTQRKNTHPTVKPLALMRFLVRLVTPRGGTVLDPFMGSGTTAWAALAEGFKVVGCEKYEPYHPLLKTRVANWVEEYAPKPEPVKPKFTLPKKRG